MADLQQQISSINQSISGLNQNIQNLQSQEHVISNQISSLNNQLCILQTDLSNAENQDNPDQSQIDSINSQISDIYIQNTSYQSQLDSYIGQITSYEGEIDDYNGELSTLNSQLVALEADMIRSSPSPVSTPSSMPVFGNVILSAQLTFSNINLTDSVNEYINNTFSQYLATYLGVDPTLINIVSITKGSIIVNYTIMVLNTSIYAVYISNLVTNIHSITEQTLLPLIQYIAAINSVNPSLIKIVSVANVNDMSTTTDVPSPSTSGVPSPSTSGVPSPGTTDVPSPSTSDVPSLSTASRPSISITSTSSPSTTEVPSPSPIPTTRTILNNMNSLFSNNIIVPPIAKKQFVTGGNDPTISKAMRYSSYIQNARSKSVPYSEFIRLFPPK